MRNKHKKGSGGNAHQRAVQRTASPESADAPLLQPTPNERRFKTLAQFWTRICAKKNDIVALAGLLASLGSWGYTVLNPQPQIAFGLFLMATTFFCLGLLVVHALGLKVLGSIVTTGLVGTCFWLFAKKVVIDPLHKRDMLAQLQVGYGLRGECGSRTYYDQTPTWMRDAQERWKSSVTSLLERAGRTDDLQEWSNSQLVGLVSDSNYNGFRCTEMAVKVAALEDIVAKHYDPTVKPNPYTGPVYVFDPATGGHEKK